jgi:prepilin-type N-terminal cleavage/methylation domain-containing protein
MRRGITLIELLAVLGILLVVLLIGGAVVFGIVNSFHNVPGQTFTVTGKENVNGNKSSKYLVYTDKTTYQIDDTWVHWRWDSSDVYGKIQAGKTYSCTLQGYRIPFLSMYPNVIDPVEVTVKPEKN